MRKLRTVLGIVLLAMLMMMSVADGVFAYDNYKDPIRVQVGKASAAEISVTYGSYQVVRDGQVISTINFGDSASLTEGMRLSALDGDSRFLWNDTEYRGDFMLIGGDAVNTLGMEQYLYSVVMQELGGYAPDVEALKAQAVACRNFAYRRLANPRTSTYDILSGTSDQAYGGYTGERYDMVVGERVRNAVDSTSGMVMYYDGELVEATYSANAGGATEDVENVWGGSRPYLKGVDSPWDAYPFIGDAGTYTSLKFPTGYEWTYTISFADLKKKVSSVGDILNVKVSHDGCYSGYAKTVTVEGTSGSKTYTGPQFRSLLGLRSSQFDAVIGQSIAANQGFSLQYIGFDTFSSVFRVSGNVLTLYGKGYGHGVGMSQWSACVMAERGYDYMEILNYFYNQNQNNGRLTIKSY